MNAPFGLFLVDKPSGPTSHDVVALIRRRLPRGTKVGHAGTLDPFATGLLVVAVGRATRLLQFLVGHDKTYEARVRLGATSVTGDPEGPITPTGAPAPPLAAIEAAVADLVGAHTQATPMHSAVRVDGERLYRKARRGEQIVTPQRNVTIRAASVLAADPHGNWFDLRVTCSTGTYVRQLAADLGDALGVGGYCETLRRTAVAELRVDAAVAPDVVPDAGKVAPTLALAPMPLRSLSDGERHDVMHGRPIVGECTGEIALVHGDEVVAIGVAADHGIHPRVVIA